MPHLLPRSAVSIFAVLIFAAVLGACSQAGQETQSASAPASAPTIAPMTAGAATFVLGDDTVARYKIEEELAGRGFTVAIGETGDVAGQIAFDDNDAVIPDGSRITLQAATFTSDSDRRDGYVRSNTLNTEEFPEIVFRPTSVSGLPSPLSGASGAAEFTISGDLTVLDQTIPVTWNATADFGDTISGTATVDITFEQLNMDKPSVVVVLSVEDTISLELDFVGSLTQ